MYNAISDQLIQIGILPEHQAQDPRYIRKQAANYMLSHPDDFMPFLPSITGEDSSGATDDGMMTESGFRKYCSLVAETGEWGGEPEVGFVLFLLFWCSCASTYPHSDCDLASSSAFGFFLFSVFLFLFLCSKNPLSQNSISPV